MKKTLRKIIASVLLLVMLFSISATAVFAVGEAEFGSDGENNSALQEAGAGSAGGAAGGVDLGWCSITYDEDSLDVVWYHDLDSLLAVNSEQIKLLADQLRLGVETIVIENLKGNIIGLQPGESADPDLDSVDKILESSLDSFVKDHSNGESDVEAYVAMFKTMLSGTENGDDLIYEFTTYVCDLVSLAVRGGVIDISELPSVDNVSQVIEDTVNDYINDYADVYMETVVKEYIAYLQTDSEERGELSDLLTLVNTSGIQFVRDELDLYIAGATTHFDDEIGAYLDDQIDKCLDSALSAFLDKVYNGTEPVGTIDKYAVGLIETYFNRAIDNYVSKELGETIASPTVIDDKVFGLVHVFIIDEVKAEIDGYADFKYGRSAEKPMLYDIIDGRVRDKIAEMNDPLVDYDNIPEDELIPEIKSELESNPDIIFAQLTLDHFNSFLGDRSTVIKNTIDRSDLESIINDDVDHDAIVAEIHNLVDSGSNDYKSTLSSIVEDLTDAEIRSMLEGVVTADGFNVENIIEDLKTSVLGSIDSSYKDKAIAEFLEMDIDTYEANLAWIISVVQSGYEDTLADLGENENTELTAEELLRYLRSVKVKYNDNPEHLLCSYENDKVVFKKDAIAALIGELPKPADIANMTKDEMTFSWAVEIETSLTSVPTGFSVNLSVGAGDDDIRKIASAISKLVEYSVGNDGKITVNLQMFESVTDVISDLLASENIAPGLKWELFDLFNMNVDEVYDYFINDFSYQDYVSIISEIDFESILLKFGIDELSNGNIVGRLSNENYFNKFKSLVEKLYSKLPEEINRELTVIEFYRGDGTVGVGGICELDLTPIIEKVSDKYGSFIATLFDETSVQLNFDLSASFKKLHSVEFYAKGEFQKSGLLPEGADHEFFFGSDRYQGYKIVSWTDAYGAEYESMPNKDVVLYANFEELSVALESDVSKVYDGLAETLEISLICTYDNPTFTYYWYKNGVLLENETGATLNVTNVLDSGIYDCIVEIVDGEFHESLVSNTVSVSITPAPKTIEDYPQIYWNYTNPFEYDGAEKSVSVSEEYSDIELISLTNFAATNAGLYTAEATYNMLNPNYEFTAPATLSLDWSILPAKLGIDDVDFVWDYDPEKPFVYEYGAVRKVSVQNPENLVIDLIGDTATNAGNYVATGFISSSNPNYEWVGDEAITLSWQINAAELDLSKIAWDYTEETKFIYNGNAHKVSLVGVPEDVVLVYSDNEMINAGSYTARASYDPNSPENSNYLFKGTVADCAWTIEKATVADLPEIFSWTYDENSNYVYTGDVYTIFLNIPENVAVTVEYVGNSATEAGEYTATATLIPLDPDNFVIDGTASFSAEWSIARASYDMSGISFEDKTVYYNGEAQGIQIGGTLPEGVTANYSQAYVEPGEYEMTVNFTGDSKNYNLIDSMKATLTILPVYSIDNSFEVIDSDGKVIVNVYAANGISSDHKLNVNDVAVSYAGFDFSNMFGEGKNGNILSAYDIHFAVNGTENPVNDIFTVTLAIPETFKGDVNNLRVVYIAENGELTDMEAMVSGGALVFETTHFSVYAVVEVVDRIADKVPVDLTWLIILIVALVVLAAAVAVLLLIKKRRGNSPENNEPEAQPAPNGSAPEEAPAEQAPAEEAPAEEAPAEEAPAEEAPAEEAPAEEAPAEEAHAEVEPPKPNFVILPDGDDGASISIDGKVVPVRYRSSFMSRLIQSEPPIQDYYNTLKNALLSYKGVKARMSWNCESFNNGRAQCAKLNVKGRTFLVYLALELEEYNVNKYHFSDASDKPKFEKVPMMLKVRSDRSLKYALELIEEVMKKNGIEKGKESNDDFHMPYETTAELARRDLVKLILPKGVSLTEGMYLSNTDVGAMLEEVSAGNEERK